MTLEDYQNRRARLFEAHEELIGRRNEPLPVTHVVGGSRGAPAVIATATPLDDTFHTKTGASSSSRSPDSFGGVPGSAPSRWPPLLTARTSRWRNRAST